MSSQFPDGQPDSTPASVKADWEWALEFARRATRRVVIEDQAHRQAVANGVASILDRIVSLVFTDGADLSAKKAFLASLACRHTPFYVFTGCACQAWLESRARGGYLPGEPEKDAILARDTDELAKIAVHELAAEIANPKLFKSLVSRFNSGDVVSDGEIIHEGAVVAHVLTCPECAGGGDVVCEACHGQGQHACDTCDGSGHVSCHACHGSGRCSSCGGSGKKRCSCSNGKVTCPVCGGSGYRSSSFEVQHKSDDPGSAYNPFISKPAGYECFSCGGSGISTCSRCLGRGWINCGACGGSGACGSCHGSGSVTCGGCGGSGQVVCGKCRGTGRHECPECQGHGKTHERAEISTISHIRQQILSPWEFGQRGFPMNITRHIGYDWRMGNYRKNDKERLITVVFKDAAIWGEIVFGNILAGDPAEPYVLLAGGHVETGTIQAGDVDYLLSVLPLKLMDSAIPGLRNLGLFSGDFGNLARNALKPVLLARDPIASVAEKRNPASRNLHLALARLFRIIRLRNVAKMLVFTSLAYLAIWPLIHFWRDDISNAFLRCGAWISGVWNNMAGYSHAWQGIHLDGRLANFMEKYPGVWPLLTAFAAALILAMISGCFLGLNFRHSLKKLGFNDLKKWAKSFKSSFWPKSLLALSGIAIAALPWGIYKLGGWIGGLFS